MKTNLINIKESGFRSPENYFGTLEDKIMHAIQEEHTLGSVKETGFKLPKNYFDALDNEVLQKIENEHTPKVIKLFSKRNLIYVSSVAAAVLLLFNLSIFDKKVTFDTLETQTVENYIINEGIDTYELAALLLEEDLLEEDFTQQSITDETLEDYLLDNLDLEELIVE
jgi:uncharacterized membrane protein YvbJ